VLSLKLKKVMPAVYALMIVLGVISPMSAALGTLAQGEPLSAPATLNINANVSEVMIKSLNASILLSLNKLLALNLSKNSAAWELIKEANQSLELALQAEVKGNYTAAVKYAQEGLAKVREVLKLLVKEQETGNYTVWNTTRNIARYESEVRALNRTAYALMNATNLAEEKGTINATIAEEIKTRLQSNIKALNELAGYLSKAANESVTLNMTYVATVIRTVTGNLSTVREALNNYTAVKLQKAMRSKIAEQLKMMQKEIDKIIQASQEAQEQNLTVLAQSLRELARNLTQKLMRIEKSIMSNTYVNITSIEELLNISNQVKVVASVSHEVRCYSTHALNLKTVISDLAKLKTIVSRVSAEYAELKSITKMMPASVTKEISTMSKLMESLQGNYSMLEKAFITGDPASITKYLNAINSTAGKLNVMVGKLMEMRIGNSMKQVKNVLESLGKDLKAITEQIQGKYHMMKNVAEHSQASKLVTAETELKIAVKQLEKIHALSKALLPAQASKIQEIQTNLRKAETLLKNGDVESALNIVKSSIEVLKEVQHEINVSAGKGYTAIDMEINAVIEVLHTVQDVIGH